MTKLEIVIRPTTLFPLLADLCEQFNASLVFQRFESDNHEAGFLVVKATKEAEKIYHKEGYCLCYVSLRGLPESSTDWDFIEREAAYLIELTGCRISGKNLEMTEARILAKKSQCQPFFKKLVSALTAISEAGVLLDEHPYPKIRYENALVNMKFQYWNNLEDKDFAITLKG